MLVSVATAVLTRHLLSRAFSRYEAAYAGDDEQALAEARYELTLALVADGWRPPPSVVKQMEKDRAGLPEPRVIQL